MPQVTGLRGMEPERQIEFNQIKVSAKRADGRWLWGWEAGKGQFTFTLAVAGHRQPWWGWVYTATSIQWHRRACAGHCCDILYGNMTWYEYRSMWVRYGGLVIRSFLTLHVQGVSSLSNEKSCIVNYTCRIVKCVTWTNFTKN